jgi:hypothetical protein
MALKDIVKVDVSLSVGQITRVGFDTALFVYEDDDEVVAVQPRVKIFGSVEEAEGDTTLSDGAKKAIGRFFGGEIRPARVKVGLKSDEETWTAALTACQQYDNDWYMLMINSTVTADILQAAEWCQSKTKLYVAKTADAGVIDPASTGDIGKLLLNSGYSRTALIYSGTSATDYPDMAWAGGQIFKNPGSITWSFKPTPGIPADPLNASAISALEAKRVTRIEEIQGATFTVGGYTSKSPMYIDIIRGIDYHAQRTAEDVLALLLSVQRVPGDDRGSVMVENVLWNRLRQSVTEGIFQEEGLTVYVPKFSERDPLDREARVLDGCTFSAVMVGAIHKVYVTGTFTV